MTNISIKAFSILALLVYLASSFLQAGEKKEDDKDSSKWNVNNPPGESYLANINVSEGTWMYGNIHY